MPFLFQYNTCFYLSASLYKVCICDLSISIQHLFLFISLRSCKRNFRSRISIQHLFLFIGVSEEERLIRQQFQYNTCFYLSKTTESKIQWLQKFQYNTCFYLSQTNFNKKGARKNFNTTLVFIYRRTSGCICEGAVISIQHLFLFILKLPAWPLLFLFISIQHLFLFIRMGC